MDVNAQRLVGRMMREARNETGLTQDEVALRLNKPQSFVSKYELGERRLDVVEVVHVCAAIGIEPSGFIHDLKSRLARVPE